MDKFLFTVDYKVGWCGMEGHFNEQTREESFLSNTLAQPATKLS